MSRLVFDRTVPSTPSHLTTMRYTIALTCVVLAAGCGAERTPESNPADSMRPALPAGESYLSVPGGKIWYKVSGSGTATPVILLHGGPGYGSFYMKAMEALSDERAVVRYDQLGGGKSDATTDTTLFNIAHFVAELDSLRSALGYSVFHVVGHSWGTILGLEYYRAHADHVASLTLMSAALDLPAWERHARELLKTLPDSSQRAIAAAEADNKYDGKAYEAANAEFMSKYVFLRPPQADLDSTMAAVGMPIYMYMQGPSEFTIVGTLRQYDATGFLRDVKVPTLFTVGSADEANPVTIRKHAAMTPGAQVVVIPDAAHVTMWDNPGASVKAVRDFLHQVESGVK